MIMDLHEEKELERFIHEQLRKLPEREAPADLVESVLNSIAAQKNRPWWRQPFTDWPRGNQALLFAALGAIFGGVFYLAWTPAEQLTAGSLLQAAQPFAWITGILEALASSAVLAVKYMPWPWLAGLAGVFALLYLACVGTGVALYRVTARPAHDRI
jgi:hypothetical protein